MKNIRYGFRLMWSEAPRLMRRYKTGKVGTFDTFNGHGGVCWGWPKECKLTNAQARAVYFACYNRRRLTVAQMTVVRKSFAYAFELTGGKPGGNFVGVKEVWGVVRQDQLPDSLTTTIPDRIPQPEDLKQAFKKGWSAEHEWSLIKFLGGTVAAWDWTVCGMRSREDIDRVKKSRDHQFNWKQGWESTSFVGGRCKLCGNKKNTRPWRVWTVCLCDAKRHVRPPADFYLKIDVEGNPKVAVEWHTTCPLAALEVLWQLQSGPTQGGPRRYGKWLDSGRFGTSNVNDVVAFAIDWFVAQGVCPEDVRFDTNAGRKSLGRWTERLKVPYDDSVEIHGDLWEVWHDSYESSVPKSSYPTRTQSTNPDKACRALRKFANFCGFGKRLKPKLSRSERLQYHLLKALKGSELANKIASDLPSESESDMDSE